MAADPTTRHTFDYFFATPGIIAGPGRVGAVLVRYRAAHPHRS
jgi:hypothetical protein